MVFMCQEANSKMENKHLSNKEIQQQLNHNSPATDESRVNTQHLTSCAMCTQKLRDARQQKRMYNADPTNAMLDFVMSGPFEQPRAQ